MIYNEYIKPYFLLHINSTIFASDPPSSSSMAWSLQVVKSFMSPYTIPLQDVDHCQNKKASKLKALPGREDLMSKKLQECWDSQPNHVKSSQKRVSNCFHGATTQYSSMGFGEIHVIMYY